MTIFHCADLHLDSKMESNLSLQKAEERQNELIETFVLMINQAKQKNAKVILIAGDLFDTKKTKQKNVKKRIVYIIQQNPQIDFLYLRGNHDDEDYFAEYKEVLPNLKLFSKDCWQTYEYGNVSITARELSNDKILDSVYSELVLDKAKINIVMLHGQISSSSKKTDAPYINLSKLENKSIDYLALGHIHSYSAQKLDSRGIYCYSGCLEGRGFDEIGDKGYVQLEIEDNKIQHTFVPIAKRKMEEVQIDISEYVSLFDILNKIKSEIKEVSSSSLVKIVLFGEISEETDLDLVTFYNELKDYFYFLKIEDKTERKIDYKKYKNDVSLKGEFVRTVEMQPLSESEKAQIIITGLKALSNKEIN